ncbi:MAG: prepilin-type N-terminal cleavage/methylation domain-containing protein [Verrucomicrobiota bacterium]
MNGASQHRSGEPVRSGFTLLETLLVLGLMSMLAAVLIGGSASLLKGTARSDPEDALLALLQTIRRASVEKGRIFELVPVASLDDSGPDFTWSEEIPTDDKPPHEETLPRSDGKTVKVLAPESSGAILLGGVASEKPLARMRFFPDGTCDRVRLEISTAEDRRITPIDPLTCAPLPAVDAK